MGFFAISVISSDGFEVVDFSWTTQAAPPQIVQ